MNILSQKSEKVNIRAAIYARYSSANQREASIDDQLRVCREYCDKAGLSVVAEYHDSAISGLTDARPEFQRMIKDGERKSFEVLVLYALDRFARDRYDSAIYKARLKKAGIRLVYVTNPVGDGPEAVLMESLLEGLAQYYSENLARSVRRGLEGKALKGLYATGHVPLGFKVDDTQHFVEDPLTSSTVQLIFESYASGMGKSEIVSMLNGRGLLTAYKRPFTRSSLDGILRNEMYTGVYIWKDIRIEDGAPALITRDLWERTQRMIAHNAVAKAKTKAKEDYLLTGKVRCGFCGAWMVGDSGRNHEGKVYLYYTCNRHKHNTKDCPKRPERKHELEALALRACRAALTDEAITAISEAAAAQLNARNAREDITPAIKAELSDVTRRIANLMDAIEQGILTPTTKDRLAELEARQKTLTARLAVASAPAPTVTAEMFAFYLSRFRTGSLSDPAYQRTLIDTLLNSITIYDEPKNKKKAVIALNLQSETAITLSGSDIEEIVDLNPQYPIFAFYGLCAVSVCEYKKSPA